MPDLTQVPELPALFRPRAARRWAYTIGALVASASVVMAIILPAASSHWTDRVGFVLFGAAVLWFCHRQASVSVAADRDGLRVRNLFRTHVFAWPEVFAVSFPVGDPWAHLDLSNGDTVSVMAVQRADSQTGVRMARELNALIQRHGTAEPS